MGYDIAIAACVIFILACVFVGVYVAYKVVFGLTQDWFDSTVLKVIFRIVLFPLSLIFVFFFLSYPILFVAGAAIQLSFHGS